LRTIAADLGMVSRIKDTRILHGERFYPHAFSVSYIEDLGLASGEAGHDFAKATGIREFEDSHGVVS
jgi:hypothetical protein